MVIDTSALTAILQNEPERGAFNEAMSDRRSPARDLKRSWAEVIRQDVERYIEDIVDACRTLCMAPPAEVRKLFSASAARSCTH